MTAEQIAYVGMQSTALADSVTITTATFNSKTIPTPPVGFPAIDQEDFQVYVNGVLIPKDNRTITLPQVGVNITVTFINLGYNIEDYPIAYDNFAREISLPIYPQLTNEQVDYICNSVFESFKKVMLND
jgi:hypothetical protein